MTFSRTCFSMASSRLQDAPREGHVKSLGKRKTGLATLITGGGARGARGALGALGVLACALAPAQADAAGLYFSDRGVRPMGRGGAFVAGADDLGAVWYNPAGIADAGSAALVDFSWLRFSVDYTRELLVR